MKFTDLQHEIVKRMARHSTVVDDDAVYAMIGNRNPQGDEIRQHVESERITNSPGLVAALSDVEAAEAKIRQTKLSGLSTPEIRKFEQSVFSGLIRGVEDRRVKRLRELANTADERRKKAAIEMPLGEVARQSLALEESKLRHTRTTESTAMTALSGCEKRGYSRADLLVLGSISDRTNAKATEVRAAIPEHLADETGVKLLGELEHLVNQKPGEIAYFFKGSDALQAVHVGDLLSDTAPTVEDLAT